jgi:predicted protein tyrosine phosphatase
MVLIVTPLGRLTDVIAERAPSHLITLLSPEDLNLVPALSSIPADRRLRIGVHDIEAPQAGLTAPDAPMVERVLAFALRWDETQPMVVHCWAGISRSTATAFAIACDRNPHVDELAIAMDIRRASPSALPNRRIVALADDILGRQGRMLEAVEAMGHNGYAVEGAPFDIAVRR